MNVLVIYEFRTSSANYNIAKRMVSELEKRGFNIINACFIEGKVNNQEISDLENSGFIAQTPKALKYLVKQHSEDWKNRSKISKSLFFLSHLDMLGSYISKKLDERSGFKTCRERIEELCSNGFVDCIIGISAPHIIEKIVSELKINVPRFIFRLDPYSYNPSFPEAELNERLCFERMLISSVDRIFTTRLIIRDMIKDELIGKYSDRFREVEFPLISEDSDTVNDLHSNGNMLFEKKDGEVYLLHAGTFYPEIRNPKKLVDFMEILPEKYKLVVAGINTADIHEYDSRINDRIIDLGCLNKTEVNCLVEMCDFLISYNNLNSNMVPSKLFECIDSCKPFINLCHTSECPSIYYVKDYDMAYTVVLEGEIDRNGLICFLEKKLGLKSTREQIVAKYERCTLKYVTGQVIQEMEYLSNKP